MRPDRYALEVAAGPPGRRAVLFALAIRANLNCGCVIAGHWLADAIGEHPGSIRRHVHALADDGIIDIRHQPGGPLLARFPTVSDIHNPAHECSGCREWGRALVQDTPRNGAENPAHWCAVKQSENSFKTPADDQHGTSPSVSEIRKIWTSARDAAREETA